MTDTSVKFQGAKYTDGYQPASLLAKAIRDDIKTAIYTGDLPAQVEGVKLTYRTTCHNYAGGRSINVVVDGLPDSWAYRPAGPGDPYYDEGFTESRMMTDQAKALWNKVEAIREAYNQDRSDVMTDYFHVNYYGSTTLWDERTQAFWQGERARKARKS